MFPCRIGVILAVLVVLAGCARGTSSDDAGMRAWVDERGQVRYRDVPDDKPEREETSAAQEQEEDATGSDGDEAAPSDPVYNLENFPAAEEATEEDEELYYTWRDAEGRVHNTPYSLSEEKIARVSRPESSEPRQKASSARVTRSDDVTGPDYNPSTEAKRILGLNGAAGRLNVFSENCCSELPRLETFQLTRDRGVGINLKEDDAIHRFSTGRSRFAVLRLPESESGRLLRLRSFIRDGAFLPNLVFLDADFQPVRLVTDITFDFSPETWSRYAFLEAFVPIGEQADERWVVIFTRDQDLKGTTTITDGAGDSTIVDHSPTGSLKLTIP